MESMLDLFWSYVAQYGFLGAVAAFLLPVAVAVAVIGSVVKSLLSNGD